MATQNEPENSATAVQQLSECVIEVLKELNAARSPLTLSALSQKLSKREYILDLVVGTEGNSGDASKALSKSQLHRLKSENRSLKVQLERVLRQVEDLESDKNKVQVFCKRALLTLMNLTQVPKNELISYPLGQFKQLILNEAGMAEMESVLQDIKNAALRESRRSRGDQRSNESSSSLWDKFFGTRKMIRPSDSDKEIYIKNLQETFLEILEAIPTNQNEANLSRLAALQQTIRSTGDFEQLLMVRQELLDYIEVAITSVIDERQQVTKFIAEIGDHLNQVAKNLLSSLSLTQQAHEANMDFARLVDNHMEDIKGSLDNKDSLAALKKMVVIKLSTIKTALEMKRQEDDRRLKEANEKLSGFQENIQSVKAEIDKVQQRAKDLEREVFLDPLTNMYNRRAYEQRFAEEWQRFKRYEQMFSLLLFDVDEFKEVNDGFGHAAGDACLKEIANRIRPVLRIPDFLARYGGDEFILILPGADESAAMQVAEKLRATVEKTRFLFQGRQIDLSISIGVAQIEPTDVDQDSLFGRADSALYEAKRTGRNRIVFRATGT